MDYLLFKEAENMKIEEMMISTSTQSSSNQSSTPWKNYHNPLYTHNEPTYNYNPCHHCNCSNIFSSSVSASLSDLTFIMEAMNTELEEARAQIIELRAKLEYEHRLRRNMESIINRMSKEMEEERRGREAMERVCEELGNRVSCHKADVDRIRREMDEERKMMKVAEVLREERVQMKLEDAKIFYEQKFLGLDHDHQQVRKSGNEEKPIKTLVLCQRRASPEPENPHIKRGIKGSVEFQRVVRALCSNKNTRQLCGNYKLECQKAQLKLLLKQRSSIQPNNLVMS